MLKDEMKPKDRPPEVTLRCAKCGEKVQAETIHECKEGENEKK